MAMSDLRLQVILQAIDRATAPLKRINSDSTATAKALRDTRQRLKELSSQQKAIGEFRELRTGLEATSARLENAREKASRLARELNQSGPPTKAMVAQLQAARQATRELSEQQQRQAAQVQVLRDRFSAAGVSTSALATHERELRANMAATTASIERQTAALQSQAEHKRRSAAASHALERSQALQAKVAGTGVAMGATGAAIGAPIAVAVRDFASFEDHMLGVARQVNGARDGAGRLTDVYMAVRQQVRELGREIPLTTNEIADMVTAGARMEVATDQLKDFTRSTAMMATAFDAVPGEIAEQMGKVAKNFKIPITQIESLADSINYLDDNAISKGDEIINVLNRISGVISTVKMSAQDAAALGSTLLTLGERPETAATAINAITQKLAAATKGTKKFQAAVSEIGLKSEDIQQGMATDASATFDKVIAGIRKLPESQRVGVMVELVGLEHSDTLAKLVDKPEELARQRELANGKGAQGSMRREADARNQTMSAQWVMAKNRAFELTTTLGETLKPALVDLMNTVGRMASAFASFAAAHPTLIAFVLKAAAALSALLVVGGALTLGLASLIGPFAMIRYGMAMMSLNGASLVATVARIGGALRLVGQLVLWLGRALLMNPIGLAITGIALAAYLLVRYWEPIKGFFGSVWDRIRTAFSGGLSGVASLIVNWSPMGLFYQALAGVLRWFGIDLPQKFTEFGANILQGLASGITSRLAMVRDAVTGAADGAIGWFKEKLGIHSPSRVFIAAGEEISNGAAAGVENREGGVRRAVMAMAAAATVAMPAAAMQAAGAAGAGSMVEGAASAPLDRRSPLSSAARAPTPPRAGDSIEIHIHAAPGLDERAIARAVAAELDRRERAKRSARLSSLSDIS